MKKKLLGTLLMTGALAFSVACSKHDKKSTTEIKTLSSENGDWEVKSVDGDKSDADLSEGKTLHIKKDDKGNLTLLVGKSELAFDKIFDNSEGDSQAGFLMADGRIIEVGKPEVKDGQERLVLNVWSMDQDGYFNEHADSTITLARPAAAAPAAIAPPAEVKPAEEKAVTPDDSADDTLSD